MSVTCFVRVQDYSKSEGLAYLLLLTLADGADDDGYGACPSTNDLARLTHIPKRDVPHVLAELQRSGELTWDQRRGVFQINVQDPTPRPRPRLADEPRTQGGYIYLLESKHGFKIGRTTNMPGRMKAFGLQLPFRAHLVHSIQVSDISWAERYLHNRFAHCRLNGEWFDLADRDVDWICSLTSLEAM